MTIGKRFVVAAPSGHFLLRKGEECRRRLPLRSAMLVATVVPLAALPAAAPAQIQAPLTDVSSASGPVSIDVADDSVTFGWEDGDGNALSAAITRDEYERYLREGKIRVAQD